MMASLGMILGDFPPASHRIIVLVLGADIFRAGVFDSRSLVQVGLLLSNLRLQTIATISQSVSHQPEC
jgi:hypothetical protein